jgi:hypothetical protein
MTQAQVKDIKDWKHYGGVMVMASAARNKNVDECTFLKPDAGWQLTTVPSTFTGFSPIYFSSQAIVDKVTESMVRPLTDVLKQFLNR